MTEVFHDLAALPPAFQNTVVMIGNFDGIHLGHQHLIRQAKEIANQADKPLVMLTFQPHPRAYFNPHLLPFRLTRLDDKIREVKKLAVDAVVALPFNDALATLDANMFIEKILVNGLKAHHIVVGRNFIFGYKRSGSVQTLASASKSDAFALTVLDLHGEEGKSYSSTRIRNYLRDGAPKRAAELLGRRFHLSGRVERGHQRGADLGFPTANIVLEEYVRPLYGVYAVHCFINDDLTTPLKGIANIGVRPTVGGTEEMLEVHLFDFNQDIYGQHIEVELVDFIREEKKFAGLDDLKNQITQDIKKAHTILDA